MATWLAILGIGFILGIRHAADPDHVIAVSTIVSREHSIGRSALIGVAWGIGHTLTIVAAGSAIILLRIALPARIGLAMELAVAFMLILLGLANVRPLFSWSIKGSGTATHGEKAVTYHSHGDYVHAHGHLNQHRHPHDPQRNPVAVIDRRFSGPAYQAIRPLVVGIVHGLAGSAAIALLVLTAIPQIHWAVTYLLVFGMGTILGMVLITLAMASVVSYSATRFAAVGKHFSAAAGLISLVFGLVIAYEIGGGLFTSHPHWIPR